VSDEFTAGGGMDGSGGDRRGLGEFMGWVARWPASKAGTGGHAENGVRCVWKVAYSLFPGESNSPRYV